MEGRFAGRKGMGKGKGKYGMLRKGKEHRRKDMEGRRAERRGREGWKMTAEGRLRR